jgi:hypothetical protein
MARKRLIPDIIRLIRGITNRVLRPDHETPRQTAAYHEAGHAVAAMALEVGVDRVTVVGDYDTLGMIVLAQGWPHLRAGFDPHDPKDRRLAENWILLALAGEFAEADHMGREPDFSKPGSLWDYEHAEALAKLLLSRPGSDDASFEMMTSRAHQFVREPLRWRQITAVATHLARLGELNRTQIEQFMEEIAAAAEADGTE